MQRRILFVEPNLSQGGNPSLPPSLHNRKPFYWNIRLEDSSGGLLASLKHNRRSFTGLITLIEPFEELSVINTRYGREWKLQSSPSEGATPFMTATHPKWWRRMMELEMDGERFVLCSKHKMGSEFAVHRVTPNLDAPGKRRAREKEGELVGEIWLESMRRHTFKASFNEGLGYKLPLFCTWLLLAISLSRHIKQRHGGSSSAFPDDRHDSSIFGASDDGCFDSHGGDGGFGDSGSCGMDSGGGSGFD